MNKNMVSKINLVGMITTTVIYTNSKFKSFVKRGGFDYQCIETNTRETF